MSDTFLAPYSTTGIGSLPFTDAGEAVSFLLDADLTAPFWPQLPRRSWLESMVPQYSEGMPCVSRDDTAEDLALDEADRQQQMQDFYEKYLADGAGEFAVSEEVAAGFYEFERRTDGTTWPVVKGQVTGPVTFTTSIKGEDKRPLYGDSELRDAAVKLLARKARWQVERLQDRAEGGVLIFLDEPVMAAYGTSAYAGVREEDVHEMMQPIFEAVRDAGGVPGMHVCGNSDWGVVLRSGVQVVNFEAYEHGDTLALYPDDVRELLDRDGYIAWGIVPTSVRAREETAESLVERLEECIDTLADKGFSREELVERSVLTPSCGTGSMDIDDTKSVFRLLRETRELLQGQ
ncbi:MAG: hypothetical protein V5A84_00390 [Planctomycetota bacterium]